MKKIAFLLLLASCQKNEPCNCGTIVMINENQKSAVIRNNCNLDQKQYFFSEEAWKEVHPEYTYCIPMDAKQYDTIK